MAFSTASTDRPRGAARVPASGTEMRPSGSTSACAVQRVVLEHGDRELVARLDPVARALRVRQRRGEERQQGREQEFLIELPRFRRFLSGCKPQVRPAGKGKAPGRAVMPGRRRHFATGTAGTERRIAARVCPDVVAAASPRAGQAAVAFLEVGGIRAWRAWREAAFLVRDDGMRKVMAVASGGGHWVELRRIMPAFAGTEVFYVSTEPRGRRRPRAGALLSRSPTSPGRAASPSRAPSARSSPSSAASARTWS